MQKVLMQLNPDEGPDFVAVYIDDVLVFSKALEDHLKHLQLMLGRLTEVGLKLKPTKCQFIRREVVFLGHIITAQGLKTSNRHITAVTEFPTPRSVREVRQFLGLSSFYRRFVKLLAKLAQPPQCPDPEGSSICMVRRLSGILQCIEASPQSISNPGLPII